MSFDITRRLAVEKRKRLVASVMGAAEQSDWWRKLSAQEQKSFRDKVLASIGVYHDDVLDVLKICAEDSVVNVSALEAIAQLHSGQRRLERMLGERG